MTDLPPMVPSAEERARDLWIRFADRWADDKHVIENCLSRAYHDGQQSRQPEIDALRAALDEAERALEAMRLEPDSIVGAQGTDIILRVPTDRFRQMTAALARIREVKRKWLE